MKTLPLIFFFIAEGVVCLVAQSPSDANFLSRWQAQATATQAEQPGWAVPVITQTTGLIQVARIDAFRQVAPDLSTIWNLGCSKGVNVIPWARTEIDFNLPPYIGHDTASAKDGFGDLSFAGKYRIAAGNEKHGNYTLMAAIGATLPTGSYSNGVNGATYSPAIGGGKGLGGFDVQSTVGATLPHTSKALNSAGRSITWNTVAQWHVQRFFWPEVESNATYFVGGSNDGRMQEFVTPGILLGKFCLRQTQAPTRTGLAAGAGMQIATSRFHAYNHSLVLTMRWLF